MNKRYFVGLLLWLGLTGCTHLHTVSTTSIPPARDKQVEAEAYRFMLLLMNFDNRYVDSLASDLAKQCPGGSVEGILTKKEGITYFPLLAHAVRVTATGYCIEQGSSQ